MAHNSAERTSAESSKAVSEEERCRRDSGEEQSTIFLNRIHFLS